MNLINKICTDYLSWGFPVQENIFLINSGISKMEKNFAK
jgi:hypothetical protein